MTEPLLGRTGSVRASVISPERRIYFGKDSKANDPRYTPTTTFETFPFPPGLTSDIQAFDYVDGRRAMAVAHEARRLVEIRDRWLNPPEWVEWMDEPAPGYPKRPVPCNEDAAKALKKRMLTNLCNARPQWLVDAHQALDAAVAAPRTSQTTTFWASCWRSTTTVSDQDAGGVDAGNIPA